MVVSHVDPGVSSAMRHGPFVTGARREIGTVSIHLRLLVRPLNLVHAPGPSPRDPVPARGKAILHPVRRSMTIPTGWTP